MQNALRQLVGYAIGFGSSQRITVITYLALRATFYLSRFNFYFYVSIFSDYFYFYSGRF